uniref:Telomerase RNA component interacting RNase n=1 Tax=Taeniopygia guttata TaxID=59729 RepID=A0A674GSC8_TAEGU
MAARGEDREAPEAPSPPPPGPGGGVNVFANDGSFLELFKRKMEAEEQQREREERRPAQLRKDAAAPGPLLDFGVISGGFGQVLTSKGDAWAKYLAEVQKYKAHQCSDDDKTRPLVK